MTFSNLANDMIFQSIGIDLRQRDFSKSKNAMTYSNWSFLPQPSHDTITPDDINRIKSLSADLLFSRTTDLIKYPNIFELKENADF